MAFFTAPPAIDINLSSTNCSCPFWEAQRRCLPPHKGNGRTNIARKKTTLLRTVTITAATLFSIVWFGLLALSLPAGAQDGWGQYCNARYQFCIDYPTGLFEQRIEADNGDGITLVSTDDGAELRTYGVMNGDELPMETLQQILAEERDDREVTYKAAKNNWFVLSGYQGSGETRAIFYQRFESNDAADRLSAMELVYPESARGTYDGLIERMSLSLTPPRN